MPHLSVPHHKDCVWVLLLDRSHLGHGLRLHPQWTTTRNRVLGPSKNGRWGSIPIDLPIKPERRGGFKLELGREDRFAHGELLKLLVLARQRSETTLSAFIRLVLA